MFKNPTKQTSEGANYGFSIQTANRKWEFCVKSFRDRDEWIEKIRLTVEGKAELTSIIDPTPTKYDTSLDVDNPETPHHQFPTAIVIL